MPSKVLAIKVSETKASKLNVNCTEAIRSGPKWAEAVVLENGNQQIQLLNWAKRWESKESVDRQENLTHLGVEIRAVWSTSLSPLKELESLNRWLLSTANSQKASDSTAQRRSLAGPRGQPVSGAKAPARSAAGIRHEDRDVKFAAGVGVFSAVVSEAGCKDPQDNFTTPSNTGS